MKIGVAASSEYKFQTVWRKVSENRVFPMPPKTTEMFEFVGTLRKLSTLFSIYLVTDDSNKIR